MSDPTSGSWLENYLKYTAQYEAPEAFHKWVGLSVLSAVLRRKVWIEYGDSRIFPNLYVILVAPPGRCRKSHTIEMGIKILKEIHGVTIEANKVTASAFVDTLTGVGVTLAKQAPPQPSIPDPLNGMPADNLIDAAMAAAAPPPSGKVLLYRECTATLVSTEFGVLLGTGAGHQSELVSLLTDLYDCPSSWAYKTRSRGEEPLDNVYISLLAATTPKYLGDAIPMSAIGGGFTSRIIFIVGKSRRHDNPFPRKSPKEIALRDYLIKDLRRIDGLAGPATLTGQAEAYFDTWYRKDRVPQTMDDRFAGYFERKHSHLLKVALLHSVSESNSLSITREHLIQALDCFDSIELAMPDAFMGVGSATTAQIPVLMEQIRENGGSMTYGELMRRNFQMFSTEDLSALLHTMYDAGFANEVVRGGTRYIRLK